MYNDSDEYNGGAIGAEAAPGLEETLKAKYGKVYRVNVTLTPDDETELDREYFFKKPTTPSYDRYLKTASKGASKAVKTFMFDNIVEESKRLLEEDLEEFPALAISIGEKLLASLGLATDTNLKKL